MTDIIMYISVPDLRLQEIWQAVRIVSTPICLGIIMKRLLLMKYSVSTKMYLTLIMTETPQRSLVVRRLHIFTHRRLS